MTDTGSCHKAFDVHNACRALGLKHLRTKPYTPKPTARPSASSREACANGLVPSLYGTSEEQAAELWLLRYNRHRPHGGIGSKPPISRLGLSTDNLVRLHS
jgi:transposase InsO family protein